MRRAQYLPQCRNFVATCLFILLSAVTVVAQEAPRVGPFGGGLVPIITPQAGDYNIRHEDVTAFILRNLELAAIRQEADRDYVLMATKEMFEAYDALNVSVNSGVFKQLSDKSRNNITVQVDEYFNAVNALNTQFVTVEAKLRQLSAINASVLPSVATVNDGEREQVLKGYGQIEWSTILAPYNAKLTELKTQASNYPFTLMFNSGIPEIIPANSGQALSFQFNQPILSAEQITELKKTIREKRSGMAQLQREATNHANLLKRLIQQFIQTYGTDERYRFRDDAALIAQQGKGRKVKIDGIEIDDYYKQRDAAFQRIVEAFWQRSYLRALYSVQIGAIQPAKYERKWVNLDKFLVATEALRAMRAETAFTEEQLLEAEANIRLILKVVDERSSQIIGDNAGTILMRANSLSTFIGGRRPSAEAIYMVFQLVLGDIKEEILLTQQGAGLSDLKTIYAQRYQSTPENKATYTKLKCGLDAVNAPAMADCIELVETDPSFVMAGEMAANVAGGISATFNNLNDQLDVLATQLVEANEIQSRIRLAQAKFKGNADRARRGIGL